MENLFIIFVALILFGLAIDGLITGSVWVKGCKNKLFDSIAHKRSRTENPIHYWFFVIAYIFFACLILIWTAHDHGYLIDDPALDLILNGDPDLEIDDDDADPSLEPTRLEGD